MSIHLLGGGWADDESAWTGRFVAEARERAEVPPVIACVLWAEDAEEGERWHGDYRDDLTKLGAGEVRIVQLGPDRELRPTDLGSADGIFVGGGLTPGYHRAIMPAADTIRGLVASGLPYAGYSAGAMIAGDVALLGGWRIGGVPVCPEASSEQLDEVTLDAGLGLVDLVVDVHAAQYGNLSRAVAIVHAGLADRVVAIDECTSLVVGAGGLVVAGEGSVWAAEREVDTERVSVAVLGA
ncbi:Type 1 glutamine amidotransferase-like domain-containing protein [Agrococcus sp. Marseille-Q4369]|uniref:Type 1 glutamine amidotransferase-like domain-containing protein n=1 Tax=Agrococcus sp. Marseille-Q4369 TaxID=2810513 RepID=UPI001B8ACC43|nr:Type 1 glutamine amidotransferase-like domain-containing protein [Agrococcus sp. Marseille-Q4369]QUW19689.1 Type 1 glutamine amidotransferase-like domain-containing protein [Agrococcus sp. Marseille-Q4369]